MQVGQEVEVEEIYTTQDLLIFYFLCFWEWFLLSKRTIKLHHLIKCRKTFSYSTLEMSE